jgi:uncharacterized membrane protein
VLPGPARDLRIDLLRGLAVLAMMVDHVAGVSPLRWLTGGSQFYTSAAEGFVLLAGLSAGLVTARAVQRGTLSRTAWRFLQRAILLYVLVGVTFVLHLGGLIWVGHSGLALTPLTSATLQALTVAFVWVSISTCTHLATLRVPRLPRPRLAYVWQITAAVLHG